MIYLLDTNVWIQLLNSNNESVIDQFQIIDPNQIRLCSVVKTELYFGAFNSSRVEDNLSLLNTLFTQFESLSFNDEAAKVYGIIRNDLCK